MQAASKWILFLLLCIIWGSSFELMKIGMGGNTGETLTAYQVAALRIFSAGLVFAPQAFFALKRVAPNYWPLIILSGCLGNLIPAFLFCIAETKINASLAGILNALTPLFTIVVGVLFFGYRATRQKWLGIIIGLLGLILLPILAGKSFVTNNGAYALLVVMATLCYGINLCVVGARLNKVPSVDIVCIAFTALLAPMGLLLYLTGFFQTFSAELTAVLNFPNSWMALQNSAFFYSVFACIMLGVVGTGVANVIFYKLVKQSGYVFASMVAYGIPLIAVIIGFAAQENITAANIVCLSIILTGVALVNKK